MMNRNYGRTLLLMLPLLLCASASWADAADALAERLAAIEVLSAEFSQTVRGEGGDVLETSEGVMMFQRPHKVRWEVREPYRYQVVTDGETLWRYDPDLEQMITEDFSRVATTPVMILGASATQLRRDFRVSKADGVFTLKPQENSDFSSLELRFEDHALKAMALVDSLGQHTRIELRDVSTNGEAFADDYFRLESAAGAGAGGGE